MNIGEAIQSGFSNYANFSDRACRSEYWYWVLFATVGYIVTLAIGEAIGLGELLFGLFALAILLPGIAVSVRRLHDTDRSGWFLLLGVIPIVSSVGSIILIVWFCGRGTARPNRFGADPLANMPPIPRTQTA